MTEDLPRIVLLPSALGEFILDPAALPILQAWRDGKLQPVVSRDLLVSYLRLLKSLGMPSRTLRWWGWWLGSPSKVLIVPAPEPLLSITNLCCLLADASGACGVVHRSGHPPRSSADFPSPPWLDSQALIQQLDLH